MNTKTDSLLSGFEHVVRENEPLAPFTRLNVGGVAEYFAEPTDLDELVGLVQRFSGAQMPVRLIGGGSNILVRDRGVPGLVLHLCAPAFCQIEIDGNRMSCGGGVSLAHFVSTSVREGFSGPEQLVGIPGTIGGALHANIGVHGVDIGSWVQSAKVLNRNGEIATRSAESITFSFGQSSLNELVILEAELEFEKDDIDTLTKRMQKLWIVRRATRPLSERNAAYIFNDHGGESASSLIDQAGLKGTQIGKVEISDREPNVFITHLGATAEEVIRLMELVQTQVHERLDIKLEPTIQIW